MSEGKPVRDAHIEYAGTTGPRIVVDDTGCFRSPSVDAGPMTIHVDHPDYKSASVNAEVKIEDSGRLTIELLPAPRLGRFRGDVINEDDAAVEATIEAFVNGALKGSQTAAGGAFALILPPGRYQAVVKAAGYFQQGTALVVEPLGATIVNFTLKKLPTKRLTSVSKDKIEISSRIPFEFGKARLLKAAEFVLDDVVDVLLANPQLGRVRVEGHSDSTGSELMNTALSGQRAEAVVEYLVARGIPAPRLEAVGIGGERPLAPNDTEEGRAKNRRVEFVLVSANTTP